VIGREEAVVASLGRIDYKWQASIIVALGLFLSILDSTIVSVALPVMRQDFTTDFNTITWVVSAYFLAQAAIIPITGYLSDLFGTKSVFVSAMAVYQSNRADAEARVKSVVCAVEQVARD